jgi:hypothetical protein
VKPPSASSTGDMNWVTKADGAAAWLFTWSPEPRIIDLRSGAVKPLPLFPCDNEIRRFMENPHDVVYSDDTIFLYSFVSRIFTATILHPDDAAWRSGTKRLDVPESHYFLEAYHDDKVLLCMGVNFWFVLRVDDLGGEKLMLIRVNSTNVLDEGLRIREIGRRMNSKVNSVKQGGYESKHGCRTWLAFNLSLTVPSWPLYIDGQVSRIERDLTQITISTYDMNSYFD